LQGVHISKSSQLLSRRRFCLLKLQHVLFSLSHITMSSLLLGMVLSVCTF
jgi:hypothetical protein